MKRDSLNLYFVAMVPEEPIYSEVIELKTEFSNRFNSSAALRSPPHITLQMPFQWQQEKQLTLLDSLDKMANLQPSFQVSLNDFGAFPPRVIYIQIPENNSLNTLQKEVERNAAINWRLYAKPHSRPFLPHLTIAFRDLKKVQFFAAWKEFSKRHYSRKFSATNLCLLKHNGRTWDILHRANFASD